MLTGAEDLDVENAYLQQAVAHFANTTTGVGALVGSYSLSSAAITSASSVPLTVEQASAAVGADNFSGPYSLTDTFSNLDSLVTASLFSGAVEVKAVAETVAQAVAMRADIGTPDTLGGEVISYSLGANLTAGDFADLSVVELDAVLGAANSSAIQHLISVEDSVSAIETDLASAASVIVSSGLPKAEIHADASVADAVNFLNNTPGTAGHVADTFDLALSVPSHVTQQQFDQFISKTNVASRDHTHNGGNIYRIGDGGDDAYDYGKYALHRRSAVKPLWQ